MLQCGIDLIEVNGWSGFALLMGALHKRLRNHRCVVGDLVPEGRGDVTV